MPRNGLEVTALHVHVVRLHRGGRCGRAMSARGLKENGRTAQARALNGTLFLEAERLPEDIRDVIVGRDVPPKVSSRDRDIDEDLDAAGL